MSTHNNGVLCGKQKKWCDGVLQHCDIYTGTLRRHKSWHANGVLSVATQYVDDCQSGEYLSWYDTGAMSVRCNYLCGSLEGIHESWNLKGKRRRRKFAQGVMVAEYTAMGIVRYVGSVRIMRSVITAD